MPESLEGGLRSIGWDSARDFELNGIRFFMEGFELGGEDSADSLKGMEIFYVLQHHLANHCMIL